MPYNSVVRAIIYIEMNINDKNSITETVETEIAAIKQLRSDLIANDSFSEILNLLENTKGRIILTGMGKSGIIAKKISASLSSTGSPSYFLHPAEASHGDMGLITKDDITIAMGGRVAEEIMFNEVTTGAQNDFEKATKIARAMVTEYGMSDLGVVQYEEQQSSVFLGRDYNNRAQHFSHEVAKQIDEEISKIMKKQYEITKKIIKENMDLLKLIAETLLEYETITKEQIDYLVKNGKMPEEEIKKEKEPKIKEAKLEDLSLEDLKDIAKEKNIKNYEKLEKEELIDKLKENMDKE